MDSFVEFAERLAGEIQGKKITESAVDRVVQLGDIMQEWVTPDNKEERLIKEMWAKADRQEKEVMASIILRMARQDYKNQ